MWHWQSANTVQQSPIHSVYELALTLLSSPKTLAIQAIHGMAISKLHGCQTTDHNYYRVHAGLFLGILQLSKT